MSKTPKRGVGGAAGIFGERFAQPERKVKRKVPGMDMIELVTLLLSWLVSHLTEALDLHVLSISKASQIVR